MSHGVFERRVSSSGYLQPLYTFWSEMQFRGKSVRSWFDGSSNRSFMVDPLSYVSFQPGVTKAVVYIILSVG